LFHTVGDRDAIVEQVNVGFSTLARELVAKMGVDPKDLVPDAVAMAQDPVAYTKRATTALNKLHQSPLYPFWRDVVAPEYEAWNKFYASQSSWEEWKTDYSTYENWSDRLNVMRATVNKRLAEQNVAPLQGPSVVALPKTVMEHGGEAVQEAGGLLKRGAQGAGEATMDLVKVVKYAAIGVLAIGGAVALASVASHVRKGTDPVQSYAALARKSR
jgi:hypothetical protein